MIKNVSSIFSQYIECIIDTYKNETQVSRIPPLNYIPLNFAIIIALKMPNNQDNSKGILGKEKRLGIFFFFFLLRRRESA